MTWTTVSALNLVLLIGSISAVKYPKIIGGTDALINNFPYIVSIRFYGNHNWAGTIISNRHILTAAHCVSGMNEDDLDHLTVHSGVSRTDEKGDVHKVQSVHIHPVYVISREKNGYDIAVITLKDPIIFNNYQQKINLPRHDARAYQKAIVIGWGMTSRTDWGVTKKLQKLEVTLFVHKDCELLTNHSVNPGVICAYESFASGTCFGDDGGPLISHGKIVGIFSHLPTNECAAGIPDFYTNVFVHNDFIKSAMEK